MKFLQTMLLPIYAAVPVIMLVYVTLKKGYYREEVGQKPLVACVYTSQHMTRETLQNHYMCTYIGLVSEGHILRERSQLSKICPSPFFNFITNERIFKRLQ